MEFSSEFFQDGPRLGNQFDDDHALRALLSRKLPAAVLEEIEPGLRRLGARAVGDLAELGAAAEASPPRHVPFDPWGRRVDDIVVSDAWRALDRAAAEEGLVATGYERKHGSHSRVHQFARIHLYHPPTAIYTCPLAMTDGAARALELYGDAELRERAFARLTSREPSRFWTSGQWMTERTGGSDVSGTSTVARPDGRGGFLLTGVKWFTSATTAQMAMTLARIEGASDLSLFFVELRDSGGRLRGIRVNRLKDKLGTKALPTAELTLEGTPARLVGGEGGGVRKISSLFNITRIYNSCCATAYMRRGIALARDYAGRREAFGRKLAQHPLHVETLAAMETEYRAALQLVFRACELLGREECGEATAAESAVLRLLTPVMKLFTAKQGISVVSETLECFGGAGYVEDTGLPRLLRDAQVLSIWEGTTNVLSLDVLRAISREGALGAFLSDLRARIAGVRSARLAPAVARAREAAARVEEHARGLSDKDAAEAGARQFAFALARAYAGALLLEQADWDPAHGAEAAAARWCAALGAPFTADEAHRADSRALGLG